MGEDAPKAIAADEPDNERNVADFAAAMLAALTAAARRSKRGEADLGAALHRAELARDSAQIRPALRLLRAKGCVANLVPLSDGGLLLTVTGKPFPDTPRPSEWMPREDEPPKNDG